MLTVTRLMAILPEGSHDHVSLDYDARLIRRKRLETAEGRDFMVDQPSLTNLDDFAAFELSDGTIVEIRAAVEELVEIKGDLARLAWHIGNRHTPCQIEEGRMLIRRDHVLEKMLAILGGITRLVRAPFTPEGGAYGMGRTMGHSHGPSHDHDHGHQHGPGCGHSH